MILSYHPCIVADRNLLCAGREPDENDANAISSADAVLLPQGCYKSLFEMARNRCEHLFPNYTSRFDYPDKIGQIRLFKEVGIPFPRTETFDKTAAFYERYDLALHPFPWPLPIVFKFNWGGEGHGVHLVSSQDQLTELILKAELYEQSGQSGFLIQELVPANGYALRVVVIGEHLISYWRVQQDNTRFCVNAAAGADIDENAFPILQEKAKAATRQFCGKTGINLAGIDFLFPLEGAMKSDSLEPLILEVNYFFGRRGIGDLDTYYGLLRTEAKKWLRARGFSIQSIE
jgi:ribosomal protein S6--L-glutamate ligase